VLAHELGHVLGYEHELDHDVMAAELALGTRLLPVSDANLRTTRRPDDQAPFSGQESGIGSQESAFSDEFFFGFGLSALDSPLSSGIQHPVSSIQHSAFRTPTSDFEIADSLFARFDDRAEPLGGFDDDTSDDRDRESEEAEDALDVWSLLYGLE
jgi:hypothetical protein